MPNARVCLQVLAGLGILSSVSSYAYAAFDGATIHSNTPRFTVTARSMGEVEPTTEMSATIWLKPHDKAGLDALAKSLYNPDSGSYRHFVTHAAFAAKFAPTAAEANTVKQFFTSNHLKVTGIGPNNFYVRASGTAAQFSSAFRVSLKNFEVDGKIVRANTEDPEVSGEAGALVASVSGLDTLSYTHPVRAAAMKQSVGATLPVGIGLAPEMESMAAKPAASTAVAASPFNNDCFTGTGTSTYTTDGGLPKSVYTGNKYTGATAGCGYVPDNIYTAYGMKPLYKKDYDGAGQTIVIIDWCGSPTITTDANAFSKRFGLPPLTSKNFKIINTPTPSTCAAPDPEINIDVEWAHAIAPGASIDLVVPPTGSFEDVDEGLFYAINYGLGNVISGSYGSEELYTPLSILATEDLISETAAVLGISANFSTGDQGDFTFDSPQVSPASVSAPADSPYATGVGGVSLALNADSSIRWTTGWGTNQNLLADLGEVNTQANLGGSFYGGSGGGESALFEKPLYQEKLKGAYRQLPDVSWLGDPFTGVYIAISEPGVVPTVQYQVYGGTSLACPMFSALWAIANQVAGQPLGQAAPYLYAMPKGSITDIVAYGSKTNVTGVETDTTGKTSFSAASLAAPVDGNTTYYSAVWNPPLYSDTGVLLTFGTDSGLKLTTGWDNVTGLGVPNPVAFVEAFKPQ